MDRDYQKIKAEYIAGGTSYRKLAEKYGVPFGTLRRVAKNEGWTQLRTQSEHKANTKIVNAISKKKAAKADKIIDVADKLLDKIAKVIDIVTDTQGIKHLTSAIKDIKDIKGIKSDSDLREQEARIKRLEQECEKATDVDTTVVVKYEEDISKWSK